MKITKIIASENENSEIVLTPAALLDLLSNIEEFKDYTIGLFETLDGNLQLQVGDSYYDLTSESDISEVSIDESSLNQISEINDEAYENVEADEVVEDEVESGVITELVKTLALGGLVRLGKNLLTK